MTQQLCKCGCGIPTSAVESIAPILCMVIVTGKALRVLNKAMPAGTDPPVEEIAMYISVKPLDMASEHKVVKCLELLSEMEPE